MMGSGTSLAAAHVAGIAAYFLSKNRQLTPAAIALRDHDPCNPKRHQWRSSRNYRLPCVQWSCSIGPLHLPLIPPLQPRAEIPPTPSYLPGRTAVGASSASRMSPHSGHIDMNGNCIRLDYLSYDSDSFQCRCSSRCFSIPHLGQTF